MMMNQNWGQAPQTAGWINPLQAKMEAIRSALLRGEPLDAIVVRLGTTPQAVENVRRGLGHSGRSYAPQYRAPVPPPRCPSASSAYCPWSGRFVSIDGTNVSGWSRRRGEPRLVQTLAVCRWFDRQHVKYVCWFDANFRHCVEQLSRRNGVRDAEVLNRILNAQPDLFKQAPAGVTAEGLPIKADPWVIRDADSFANGMILSGDLYRKEAQTNPELFGWTQRNPGRRITGGVAANGDVCLGANAEIRIPVVNDAESYIR